MFPPVESSNQHPRHLEELSAILETLALTADETQLIRLLRYCRCVADANTRTNLTGAKSLSAFIGGPLFDALTLVPVLLPNGTLVDVGSGAGLPGLPAGILRPELKITLVEPRTKRVEFLEQTTADLEMAARVKKGKDSSLVEGEWDGAVAQAVWGPATWMERGARLVRPGGALYVMSSTPLAPDLIPDGLLLEGAFETRRPSDDAARYTYRLTVQKMNAN